MTLTETDKMALREIAREIVKEIGPDIAEKAAWKVIREHQSQCPFPGQAAAKIEVIRLESRITSLKLIIFALLCGASGGGVLALVEKLATMI